MGIRGCNWLAQKINSAVLQRAKTTLKASDECVCCHLHVMSSEEWGVTRAADGQLLFGRLVGVINLPNIPTHIVLFSTKILPPKTEITIIGSPKPAGVWAHINLSQSTAPRTIGKWRIHKANLSAFPKCPGLGSIQLGDRSCVFNTPAPRMSSPLVLTPVPYKHKHAAEAATSIPLNSHSQMGTAALPSTVIVS